MPAVAIGTGAVYRVNLGKSALTSPANLPATVGALVASGYRARTVKVEIQENLLEKSRSVSVTSPGIADF